MLLVVVNWLFVELISFEAMKRPDFLKKHMKLKSIIVTTLLLVGLANTNFAQKNGLYKVVYEADREGKRISGSLEELVSYVRSGNPIRVGWELGKKDSAGIARLQHWTDAGFLTVIKGHVFGQISSIYGQGTSAPDIDIPAVHIFDEPDGWVAVIGTTGVLRQKFKTDQVILDAYKKMGLNDEEIEKQLKAQETSNFVTRWAVMIK